MIPLRLTHRYRNDTASQGCRFAADPIKVPSITLINAPTHGLEYQLTLNGDEVVNGLHPATANDNIIEFDLETLNYLQDGDLIEFMVTDITERARA